MSVRGEELLGTPLPPGTLLRRELVGTGAAAGGRRLSLLQFNVLADGLSGNCEGKGGFTLIPSAWLDWEQRWPLLLKVIQQTDADIVALQEVDHVDQWVKAMDGLGYEGQVRIDERSPCLKASLGDPATGEKFPDAVALFWRRERLSVDECQHGVDGEYKSKVLTARLRCLESGSYFVAVNMHLDSKKSEKGVRIRAEQSRNLLSEVSAFAQHEAKPAAAVLIAGDLNATRAEECHSSILQADFGDRLGAIRDAYADAGFSEDFTSLKIRTGSYKAGKAKYAVDHIFHSECGVSAAAVLKLSTEEEVGENGLPSVNWPSDHLSLYVEFALSGDSWASIDETGAEVAETQAPSEADDEVAPKRPCAGLGNSTSSS